MPVILLPIISSVAGALRIPAIAMFFGSLAAQVMAFFARKLTRGFAINLTIVVMIIGLAAGLSAAIYALFGALSFVVPPALNQAVDFFLPSNSIPCFSAVMSARLLRWVWEWQYYAITKVAGV
ncbi:DUF5455 family protein [Vibrio profundum]|uniref:DUF5455 family protein n=1 Tax=Vibrio profundum TaxID=2910247 RepID=UPI003D097955